MARTRIHEQKPNATASPTVDQEWRERSRSFSNDGQRHPPPKPSPRVPRRARSVRHHSERSSLSADSSPQQPREKRDRKTRSILQPTPLVMALGKQLMSQLVSDTNEISDEETRRETDGSTNPQGRVERERERIPLTDKVKVDEKNVQASTERSPIIRRPRAFSEPRRSSAAPMRPPPPSHPPPPNPRLSQLINDHRVPQNVHVIDSRTKNKPSGCPSSTKTTKYGTPPPSRPAPPPPNRPSSPSPSRSAPPSHACPSPPSPSSPAPSRPAPPPPTDKVSQTQSPTPKPRQRPVPKPRSSSFPKVPTLQDASLSQDTSPSQDTSLSQDTSISQDANLSQGTSISSLSQGTSISQDTNTSFSQEQNNAAVPCVDDSVQPKDKSYPVYEDIDRNETNYEVIDHSSDSEDDCELPAADKSHGNRELEDPPPLPPKRGTKVQASKEQDELPTLPPRSLPVKRVRKHRLLASREGQGREEKEEEETNELEYEDKDGEMAEQDAGVYEPINYHSSDDESKDYTEMNDPADQAFDDNNLENDEPEDIYITMDPHVFIPPPDTYNHKRAEDK